MLHDLLYKMDIKEEYKHYAIFSNTKVIAADVGALYDVNFP